MVRICERCKSSNLVKHKYFGSAKLTPDFEDEFECLNCGHIGLCPDVDEEFLKKLNEPKKGFFKRLLIQIGLKKK